MKNKAMFGENFKDFDSRNFSSKLAKLNQSTSMSLQSKMTADVTKMSHLRKFKDIASSQSFMKPKYRTNSSSTLFKVSWQK